MMDRISSLPDEVLGHVLSFLPTKQAALTSTLSKRWRNVYVLVSHLNLDSGLVAGQYHRGYPKNFIDFVESLLKLQGKCPLKKLTLKSHLDPHVLHPILVKDWIRNALERGVVDLNLFITFEGKSQPVPSLIFRSQTLTKLRLGRGFKIILSEDFYLPMLKTLCLDSVDSNGDHGVIETLLPHCPMLEELVLEEQRWEQQYGSVSSPSLKRLRIRFYNTPNISLDVPNLVYLELACIFGNKYTNVNLDSLLGARLNLSVDQRQIQLLRRGAYHLVPADMMDLINGIKNVRVLHLNGDALELMYFSGQDLPMFNNLVSLSITSDKRLGWQILPVLIKNSPNLETLIFKGLEHHISEKCGDACVCYGFIGNSSCCLSSSQVKVLEIWGYQGTSRELNLMKHFLKMLPCLELVKIRTVNNLQLQVPVYTQHLMTFPRASSNCNIQVNI